MIIGLARAIGETAPIITIGALTFIAFLPPAPLPPSTTMSPGSRSAASSSMTASVPAPALTMMMIRLGRSMESTKSSIDSAGMKVPSEP